MRLPTNFDQLTPDQQLTALDIAKHVTEHWGGYRGTESDAVTDAMWLVSDLGINMPHTEIDLRIHPLPNPDKEHHAH